MSVFRNLVEIDYKEFINSQAIQEYKDKHNLLSKLAINIIYYKEVDDSPNVSDIHFRYYFGLEHLNKIFLFENTWNSGKKFVLLFPINTFTLVEEMNLELDYSTINIEKPTLGRVLKYLQFKYDKTIEGLEMLKELKSRNDRASEQLNQLLSIEGVKNYSTSIVNEYNSEIIIRNDVFITTITKSKGYNYITTKLYASSTTNGLDSALKLLNMK